MSSDFLDLTNRILIAFNEVNLTSGNFNSATGFHADAKESVRQAIFDIYTYQDTEWPFLWGEYDFDTVPGQVVYAKDANAISVDWDSFYIAKDSLNNVPRQRLKLLDWDNYKQNYADSDGNLESDGYSMPDFVVRRTDNSIILSTVPDIAYNVNYEGFTLPASLSAATDTALIPVGFDQVIVDKAFHYAYMFRDNVEQAALAQDRYEKNINKMRRILIPQPEHVRFE